ncbi:MAG: glycosyltransferase [Cyclobacteriaceae bacterium]|nr:glycosyltransferase [Cyclobacteriaceae bacterium]
MLYLAIFFLLAFAIRFFFQSYFGIAFLRKANTEVSNQPPLSVIVCAHDEYHNLTQLLPLLLEQSYPEFEIILVNDRSNDETYDWLLQQSKLHKQVKVVQIDHTPAHINGKKYGLTLGIRAAANEWLIFTDADCRPVSKNWLAAMARQMSDTTCIVTGISPYQKAKGFLNLFIRFEAIITAMRYIGFAVNGMPYMGVGRNLAYRKSLFMQNKGFTNILGVIGGDDDLFVNNTASAGNTRVCFSPESIVHSIPAKSAKEFFNQKIRHLAAGKKYKTKHRLVLGLDIASWLLFYPIAIILLFSNFWVWTLSGVAVALLATSLTTYLATKRWGQRFELWTMPLLDFLYPIYYLTTGTTALITKKIKWKN